MGNLPQCSPPPKSESECLLDELPESKKHIQRNTRIALLLWFILATIGIVMSLSSSGSASSGSIKEDKIISEIKLLRQEIKSLERKIK